MAAAPGLRTTVVGARSATGVSLPEIHIDAARFARRSEPGPHRIDAAGTTAVPGLIDIQVNGGFGHDFTADPGSIWEVASRLPEYGVSSFLPTIISSAPESVVEARRVLAAGPPSDWMGARPLGLHCEGPVLSPKRRGTHPLHRLRPAATPLPDSWGGPDGVLIVTVAPELDGALDLIRSLAGSGIVVSLGHSDCTVEEARAGFAAGATAVTHLFNAMSGLAHRSPGLAAAALVDETVFAGLIADGLHVDPIMVELAAKALGPERLVLVTDAIAAAGVGDGDYELGDVGVRVEAGRAVNGDGTLAGSTLTMDAALRNLIGFTGWSLDNAVRAASETPARMLGMSDRGRIESGAIADLVLLDDDHRVTMTMVEGEIVYRKA